jgi:3-oxoisoapionate decarboxylase
MEEFWPADRGTINFTDNANRDEQVTKYFHMRLGISSYTYGWNVGVEGNRPYGAMTALGLVERAASLKVGVVQLCDNLPAATFEESQVPKICAAANERGISLELGTRGSSPAHLRRFIRLAHVVGSPILRLVIDAPGDEPSESEVVKRIGTILADLEAHQITLAIENHDRFKSSTLLRLIRELSSPRVGICLDTVNSFGALEGPEVVVETLGPYVVNLHLKDFAVQRQPYLQGFVVEGRPAGQGRLNIPWLLNRLSEFLRDPSAILELWTPPEATMDETIEKERLWAEQSVITLRQWINN